eukprot:CAMPEP_0194279258 /NCGR_PEP_ID=MMETSP0169-20130528/13828_1 /TAXON_ID=218684 /ORGANISM="Corethron pennatum, Strain L29A3" /LENGTH=302 /DNA_ID=CAMNT_0039023659 /DNA_START=101 /DNA_END=1009 /DNA_ORIENTATION=+
MIRASCSFIILQLVGIPSVVRAFTTTEQHNFRPAFSLSARTSTSDNELSASTAPSRRQFGSAALLASASIMSSLALPEPSFADSAELIDVYFGCGCFWHVQHEFVEAEKKILGRPGGDLTARAGYAGGIAGADAGRVCYHNGRNIADYGKLGHGEVVGLKIPPSAFPGFAEEYFKLFDKNGLRPDQAGDRGLEYRNLVGFPGGAKSEYSQMLIDASKRTGDKVSFSKGKGDDPDARSMVFVMDSNEFPFFVGEQYHQFHDGFAMGENYPSEYNNLAGELAKSGKLQESKCPNGMLGIGLAGL